MGSLEERSQLPYQKLEKDKVMKSYRFQVETVTPLAIAGADNRNPDLQAEGLRPPSLRGAMRWWFRALMGGIVGSHNDYRTLRDLEGGIFGATDRASTFQIRTRLCEANPKDAYLCMNDRAGTVQHGKRIISRVNIRRLSLAPPSRFHLSLQCRKQDLPLVLGSLWLSAMLGGVGARSRRGFGSLILVPDNDATRQAAQELGLNFSYSDASLEGIESSLETQLQKVHNYFVRYASGIGSPSPARYPVLSQTRAKLWLIKPQEGFWAKWEDSMNKLREDIYRAFKNSKGLSEIGSARPGRRQASPLIIQIKRATRDNYFGVLLAFDEQFNGQKYLGTNGSDFIGFLKGLKGKGYEYQEVRLP